METVNKVVDAGYKAIWGEQNTDNTNSQTTASGSQPTTSTGMTGIPTVDKVVEAGKKAIWGESTESQQQTSLGEEPVAGKRGLGTATDPYDAGNRDGILPFHLVHRWCVVTDRHRTIRCSFGRSRRSSHDYPS